MDMPTGTVPWVVCAASAIAALTDVWRFKVYNKLTFPVLFGGIVYHAWTGGWPGIVGSLLGVATALAIMIVPYLIGALGAGDVKFFMSLGAWLGAWLLVPVFAVGALAAGIYAVVQAIRTGNTRNLFWNLQVSYLRLLSMSRMLAADDCREDYHDWVDHKDRHKRLIPFSAMLAVGLVITLLLSSQLQNN